jgi:hypothetical protein
MRRQRVIILSILLVVAAHSIEQIRQREISWIVSIVRSDRTEKMLLGGTPVIFTLGWKHPCFLILPGDRVAIAANMLRTLSSTIRSNPSAAINSTDRHQRFLGVLALAELDLHPVNTIDSIAALRLALKDADPDIRNLAIVALTEAKAITISELQAQMHDPQTRITAARAASRYLGKKSKSLAALVQNVALHESQICPYVTEQELSTDRSD